MENDQPSGRRPEQIDFPAPWVLTRGAQLPLGVDFRQGDLPLGLGTAYFSENLYSHIGAFLMICLVLGRVATGTVDS